MMESRDFADREAKGRIETSGESEAPNRDKPGSELPSFLKERRVERRAKRQSWLN
jgi:hypothetical protein